MRDVVGVILGVAMVAVGVAVLVNLEAARVFFHGRTKRMGLKWASYPRAAVIAFGLGVIALGVLMIAAFAVQ